jgi:hypothetical protein
MFLVNQLVVDDKTRKQMTKTELNARVTYTRLWKRREARRRHSVPCRRMAFYERALADQLSGSASFLVGN